MYVRTYVRTSVRTYVRIFGFSDFLNFGFLGFSDFPTFGISVFQILVIGVVFLRSKTKGRVKVPLSQPKLRFGAPKGVITARKKSHSTIRIVFSLFFGFWDF